MLTQAYAHQCFAYATGPYKDPNTKHKHGGLKRGSYNSGPEKLYVTYSLSNPIVVSYTVKNPY